MNKNPYLAAFLLLALAPLSLAAPTKEPVVGPEHVVFHTVAGDLEFELYPTVAPKTVAHFLELVNAGAYDTTHFWRVEPNFVVQTTTIEDRTMPLKPAQRALERKIPLETAPGVIHERGVLSMARDDNDPNSADSSFSILLGPAPHLDGKYTIFGRLEKGQDVLAALEKTPIEGRNKPTVRLTINQAVVVSGKDLKHLTLAPAQTVAPMTAASESAPSCHPSDGSTVTQTAPAPTVSSPGTQVTESVAPDGEHLKTVLLKDFLIDKLYPSMMGPWKRTYLSLDTEHQEPYVWITRYRAEVLEGGSDKASQEFMCHTKLDIVPRPDANGIRQGYNSQFVISQGQEEVRFPAGYALRIPNDANHEIDLNAMVLNNNYPTIHRTLDFKATIGYLKDSEAHARHLKPLAIFAASVYCPTVADPQRADEEICVPAEAQTGNGMNAPRSTGHWLVPPGQHVYRAVFSFPAGKTTLHYVLMHVHPYAQSVEIYDKTDKKTLWKGSVKNDPHKAIILDTEHYSSPKGLTVVASHQYEMIATYNNRTSQTVDAMASLWMYLEEPS